MFENVLNVYFEGPEIKMPKFDNKWTICPFQLEEIQKISIFWLFSNMTHIYKPGNNHTIDQCELENLKIIANKAFQAKIFHFFNLFF